MLRKNNNILLWIAVMMVAAMAVVSCASKKNTANSRFFHAFHAKYNIYYNGSQAYIDASTEKENGNKDNFTERIPLYTVSNKSSRELGKGNYDKAIEKAQKAIKLHSIRKRPEWNKDRKKTEKDIEWLNRKEYNPFLWKAWMLMGRSQFHKGDFDGAAATFSWMSRLYKTQPAIYGKARAWLAKCYIEEDWIYDAEDVIRNMQRDSIDWRAEKEWDYTYADYYLHTGDLENASKYLRKVIKHEMRKKQKAREWYLLGQIEAEQGHKQEAYNAYKKVIGLNPPYELEFNARISMTEVLANSGQAKKMISRLKRMARDDNNAEYLDQVYYAMGNIYLAEKDTLKAIGAYEKGNEKATRAGIEKGVLLLHLGDLYWTLEKYGDAQRCYGEAIGLLDKDRPDYEELADRSKKLDELVPFTDAIHLQDSLQALAKMDEKERNEAIERVIEALKKKEKEERDKEAEANAQRVQQKNNTGQRNTQPKPNTPQSNNGTWYFYNPMVVQQGKQAFERQWGKRENQDDWQRTNKTVVGGLTDAEAAMDSLANLTDEQRDSIAAAEAAAEKLKEKDDSAVNDPHKREYYLAQIPFTEDQVAASNEIIKDGLFHAGIIFKDKLDNLPLSEKQFARLQNDFPAFEPMDEVYYHMFLLHSRKGEKTEAQRYTSLLMEKYPQSQWTKIITDPYFEENALYGKHIEDSLYQATYSAFLAANYDVVKENVKVSDSRFILGENRDKFLFFDGMTMLNEGDTKGCLARMDTIVKAFPKSSVAGIAGMIINGVKEGRTLHGANFTMTDIWNRRSAVMADSDSVAARTLTMERNIPFTFMLVYNPDSVQENKLLFQLARYNFTSFVVRNFELEITQDEGLHRMNVTGFRSFDEARQYARLLYASNSEIPKLTRKCRPIVISDENIELLGVRYSYNDYDTFYVAHFASLGLAPEYMLYEPDQPKEKKNDIEQVTPALPSTTAAPGGVMPVEVKKDENDNEDDDENVNDDDALRFDDNGETIELKSEPEEIAVPEEIVIPADTNTAVETEEIIIPADTNTAVETEEIVIPADTNTAVETEEIVIPADTNTAVETEEIVIPADTNTAVETEEIIIEDGGAEVNTEDNETIEIEEDSSSALEDEYYELDGF